MIDKNKEGYLAKDNVVVFYNSDADIGYYARTSTKGKELDLVNKYIDYLKSMYSRMKTKRAAIFIEPLLETGYPDIVVVEYYSTPDLQWNDLRKSLNSTDLKILFFIQTMKNTSIDIINEMLGYSFEIIQGTVKRLSACGLIRLSKDKSNIKSIAISRYCRVNKIIAIEAKIDKWRDAICQATKNIWFASESYILLNKKTCSAEVINACCENGIGIITINGKVNKILPGRNGYFPVSYASLQFNEFLLRWVYRKES